MNSGFHRKAQRQMFLSVSGPHVGAHPDWRHNGVSMESSINLGKQFIEMFRI